MIELTEPQVISICGFLFLFHISSLEKLKNCFTENDGFFLFSEQARKSGISR